VGLDRGDAGAGRDRALPQLRGQPLCEASDPARWSLAPSSRPRPQILLNIFGYLYDFVLNNRGPMPAHPPPHVLPAHWGHIFMQDPPPSRRRRSSSPSLPRNAMRERRVPGRDSDAGFGAPQSQWLWLWLGQRRDPNPSRGVRVLEPSLARRSSCPPRCRRGWR